MPGPVADYAAVQAEIARLTTLLNGAGVSLQAEISKFVAQGAQLSDEWLADADVYTWKDWFEIQRASIESVSQRLAQAQNALHGGLESTADLAFRLRPRLPDAWAWAPRVEAARESVRQVTQQVAAAAPRIGNTLANPRVVAAAEAAAPEVLAVAEANLPGVAAAVEANAGQIASAIEANAAPIVNAARQFGPQIAAQAEQNAPVLVPAAIAAGTAAATAAEGGAGVAAGAAGGSWFGPVGIAIGIGIVLGIGWWANRDTDPGTQNTTATIGVSIPESTTSSEPTTTTTDGPQGLEAIPGTYGINVSGDNTCPFFATSEGHQAAFDVSVDGTTVRLAFSGGAFVGTLAADYTFDGTARDDNITGSIRGQFVPSSNAVAIREGYFWMSANGVECSTTFTGRKQG